MGIAVIGVIMVYGTMDLAELVRAQKGLFPIAVVNVVVTAVVLVFFGEAS